MHDGWVRSKPQRAGLWYSSTNDAVNEQRNRCGGGRSCCGCRCEHLQNVDAEEVTAMRGEVVVDGEAGLSVERLVCRRLHNTAVTFICCY